MVKSFVELRKSSKQDGTGLPPYKLALLGNCSTQHLAIALKGYAFEEAIGLNIFEADYDQIDAQVMDVHSELYDFCPDAAALCLCAQKLYEAYGHTAPEDRSRFADTVYAQINYYWRMLNQQASMAVLQFNFAEEDDGVFGNFANQVETSFLFQVRKLNFLLMQGSMAEKNIFLIDINRLQQRYGREKVFDDRLYYAAKMPFSTAILPFVAKQVTDVVKALLGKVKKCVVLDLDNTLWGGVIGDDGLNGIQIGELGAGRAFSALQAWLKELGKRGILLAVCSKNNEDTAKEPFLKLEEMVLRLDDFAMFVANWDNKADNIRYIQKTLNIGMDSMVFLDDNPFERDLVRTLIPDITVPDLPEDPALYLSYIKNLNLFETTSFSDTDRERTKQYQTEISRLELQKQFSTYDDYLVNLEMVAQAEPFESFYYPRIAQLTQRSNQFNLRTVRYTEAEIESIANSRQHVTLYFTLKDKLSNYGLISVVILEKQDDETLFINTWLMSCRVLKRGVEEFIINKIMETAKRAGYKNVIGEYLKTPKNAMVEHIYQELGFEPVGQGRFLANTGTFTNRKTTIKENTDEQA